jgi:hypothetical protein
VIDKRELHLFLAGKLTPEQEAQIEGNQLLSVNDLVAESDNPFQAEAKAPADQQDR